MKLCLQTLRFILTAKLFPKCLPFYNPAHKYEYSKSRILANTLTIFLDLGFPSM